MFLSTWFVIWTGGVAFMIAKAIQEPTPRNLALSAGFGSVSVLVGCMAAYQLWAWESLRVVRDGFRYEWGILGRFSSTHRPIESLCAISRFSTAPDNDTVARQSGLAIENTGQPIQFAKGAGIDEVGWLADIIHRHLAVHRPGMDAASSPGVLALSASSDAPLPVDVQSLPPALPFATQPAGSTITLQRDSHCTRISHRGSFKAAFPMIATFGFIFVFWNAFVGLWVIDAAGAGNLLQLLAAVPFVLFGMLLLVVLLMALGKWAIRSTWMLQPGELVCKRTVLGVGPSRSYPFDRLSRIELRRAASRKKLIAISNSSGPGSEPFLVDLIKQDGATLAEIGPFSESDARWVAGELMRSFREWMVPVG